MSSLLLRLITLKLVIFTTIRAKLFLSANQNFLAFDTIHVNNYLGYEQIHNNTGVWRNWQTQGT